MKRKRWLKKKQNKMKFLKNLYLKTINEKRLYHKKIS